MTSNDPHGDLPPPSFDQFDGMAIWFAAVTFIALLGVLAYGYGSASP